MKKNDDADTGGDWRPTKLVCTKLEHKNPSNFLDFLKDFLNFFCL